MSLAAGGSATIEIRPGAAAYTGSARNGVTSSGYGPFSGSFVFVAPAAARAAAFAAAATAAEQRWLAIVEQLSVNVAAAGVNMGGWGWDVTASAQRARGGERFAYGCPPGGGSEVGRPWGTDTYTDDSSVCSAAVHAGLITAAAGGTVTIEVRPGLSAYTGSARNGVTTRGYGAFGGSFAFPAAKAVGTPAPPATTTTAKPPATTPATTTAAPASGVSAGGKGWAVDTRAYRGKTGARYSFVCPPGGAASTVWGSGSYTDDSSVCTAAVHAGLIGFAQGGTVTVEVRAGLPAYAGSTSNGVTTKAYGGWHGTFVFVR